MISMKKSISSFYPELKILQINTGVNHGSTGRIAESIGKLVIAKGGDSYIAYGRTGRTSESQLIRIGGRVSVYSHVLKTRLFDAHGFGSYAATERFIRELRRIDPDIIHLHNIHGYYIHIGLLFSYLKQMNKPVVWTLHDCWSFTGHCSYFDHVNCDKWKTQCHKCPNIKGYPTSWLVDRSKSNYLKKKELFSSPDSLHLVTPSRWLAELVKVSFLKNADIRVIHNGIDLNVFKPEMDTEEVRRKYSLGNKSVILGVAIIWSERKGMKDFLELNKLLHANEKLVLVGLSKQQLKSLPSGIVGIERTESVDELAGLYAVADVYVNPTYLDNFPTTNIEALACGTPVITYNTGGSPEAIDDNTGISLQKGDLGGIREAIDRLANADRDKLRQACKERAHAMFNNEDRFNDYISLYQKIMESKQ
jgi:putative colanic acid biosynthesis glycosyltransferase